MTRIVFILPDLPLAGAATRTAHLAEHLVGEGFAVTIVSFLSTAEPTLVDRLWQSGVECLRLTTPWGFRRMCELASGQHDVVLHSAMPTAGLLGLAAARLFRRPLVHSFTNALHALRPLPSPGVSTQLKGGLESLLARHANVLHAVSQNVADQLLLLRPQDAERLQCVTHNVTHPADAGSESASEILQATKDAWPKILCVGRLEPHKRFDDAIGAVEALRAEHPAIALVVLGTGPDRGRLEKVAEAASVAAQIRFAGASGAPREFYRWADVLLHPSVYEGYPRVFAEAAAEAVPVVTIDAPYARASPIDAAYVLRARPIDPASLASKVADALDLRPHIPNGEHDDAVHLPQLCELYQQLAAQQGSA